MPQGANWHQLLLQQMTTEVTNIRPAVISQDSCQTLEAYRGLRHVVRNIYAFQLDAERLKRGGFFDFSDQKYYGEILLNFMLVEIWL